MSTATTPDDSTTFEAPDVKGGYFGVLGRFVRYYLRDKRLRRKAGEGYILWYLIEDGHPNPKFIKPESDGAGVPEYEHGDDLYLFPYSARYAHKDTGMWVVYHQKGDSLPMTMHANDEPSLEPGVTQQFSQLKPQTDPPSWFDDIDITMKQVFMGLLAFIVIFAVLQGGI